MRISEIPNNVLCPVPSQSSNSGCNWQKETSAETHLATLANSTLTNPLGIYHCTHLGLGHGLALEQGLALVPCRNGLIPQGKETNSGATIAGPGQRNPIYPQDWINNLNELLWDHQTKRWHWGRGRNELLQLDVIFKLIQQLWGPRENGDTKGKLLQKRGLIVSILISFAVQLQLQVCIKCPVEWCFPRLNSILEIFPSCRTSAWSNTKSSGHAIPARHEKSSITTAAKKKGGGIRYYTFIYTVLNKIYHQMWHLKSLRTYDHTRL